MPSSRTHPGPAGRSVAAAIALGVLLSAIWAGSAAAIDLQSPEQGITDPVAGMAALVRDCESGDVDVNTAASQELADGLGLESGPTIERIVAGRPWLKATDLISVPGVPPSAEGTLKNDACATPPELPMPTPLACATGSSAVDLQAAPALEIAHRLLLALPVAERLVAARPIPQDLSQIATPRVPGLSGPTIERLVEEGSVCVTPAPFAYLNTTWRWASEEHGVVAEAFDDSRYALIVPAGATVGPTGAWAAIKPLAQDGSLPRVDLHIHGEWAGEVGSRMPDPAPYAGGAPAVQHDTGTGDTAYSWGDSVVTEAAGTVVSAMTSLSISEAYDQDAVCTSNALWDLGVGDAGSLLCAPDSPRDALLEALVAERGTAVGRYWAAHQVSGPCHDQGLAVSSGGLPFGMLCQPPDVEGTTATWTIENNTGVNPWGVATSYGTLVERHERGNLAFAYGNASADQSVYSLYQAEFARRLAAKSGLLLGATSIEISKLQGSGPSTFHHGVVLNPQRIAEVWLSLEAYSVLDSALEALGIDSLAVIKGFECIDEIGAEVDFESVASCVEAFTDGYLATEIQFAEADGDDTRKSRLQSIRKGLSSIGKRLTFLPRFGAMALFQIGSQVGKEDLLTLHYLSPPRPAGGGGLAGDGSFIVRTADRRGYLVAGGDAQHITSESDFLCYASNRFVLDLVDRFKNGDGDELLNLDPPIEISDDAAPACSPPTVLARWDYEPEPDGNTPRNVILRGDENDAVVSAWLINSQGEIQTIPNGDVYECLVLANPVIWNVPFDKIQAWPTVGSTSASCGPGG
jgi:hypothetical protein